MQPFAFEAFNHHLFAHYWVLNIHIFLDRKRYRYLAHIIYLIRRCFYRCRVMRVCDKGTGTISIAVFIFNWFFRAEINFRCLPITLALELMLFYIRFSSKNMSISTKTLKKKILKNWFLVSQNPSILK